MDVIILCVGTGARLSEETVNKPKPMEEIGGMPVLLIEQSLGLQYNPIPDKLDQDLWKQCRSSQDILDGIKIFRERDNKELARHHELGLQIRDTYFEPVTRERVLKLVGIEGNSIIGEK